MATNIERRYVSNTASQTESVSSPILWQCVYIIRTGREFQNLGHRVTKTHGGVEVVVVYREGVSGIFGPPLDPVTLTLDPNGRCHVSILFRPVQRVSVVASDTGRIDIKSLMDLLRMVAGKGYLFCPGLPEKFVAGKACGKFVVLHKVPFKRYQSAQCPVYYQLPTSQQNNAKKSLCSLCPRCMQAAKWVQSLPALNVTPSRSIVQPPTQPLVIKQVPDNHKDGGSQDSSNDRVIMSVDNNSTFSNTLPPALIGQFLSAVKSGPSGSRVIKINCSDVELAKSHSVVDMNGNRHADVGDFKKSNSLPMQSANEGMQNSPSLSQKSETASSSLQKLLLERLKRRSSVSTTISSNSDQDDTLTGTDEKVLNGKNDGVKKSKRNICRQCNKPFSSPASLLNHLQRHEALSGSWQKQLKRKQMGKANKNNNSAAVLRIIRRKSSKISHTSMRLLWKYLDDMMPSQNGVKYSRDKQIQGKSVANSSDGNEKKDCDGPSGAVGEMVVNENGGKRKALKRTSSGVSPMQTLLEAAVIASGSSEGASNTSRTSISSDKEATAVGSSVSSKMNEGYDGLSKKPRKSSRLASKREKGKQSKTQDRGSDNELKVTENRPGSHDPSMLTNLNLLSTVSLETANFEKNRTPSAQTAISNTTPVSILSPQKEVSAVAYFKDPKSGVPLCTANSLTLPSPTSLSVSIPKQLLNNSSGGNIHFAITTEAKQSQGRTDSNCNLPPLPPLLYAGGLQGTPLQFPDSAHISSSKHTPCSTQVETITGSPWSILRSLVTVNKDQPVTSAAAKPDSGENSSGSCGAIDLSKPKQTEPILLHMAEKSFDLNSFSGLPHNFAQLVANNDNPAEMLQYLMMVSKSPKPAPAQKESQPPDSIISDKKADSNLQARMFASARNYKIGKAANTSSQVQAVIASSSHLAPPGKSQKGGVNTPVPGSQGDEIQCGYKWSGSGGLVKERTQMVRELVPSDVMSNYLVRAPYSSDTTQLKKQQPTMSSSLISPPINSSQDHASSQLALNLTTAKSAHVVSPRKVAPGRLKKSESGITIPPSPPSVPSWSTSPPTPRSILRSSLLHPHPSTGIVSHLMGSRLPTPVDTTPTTINSMQKSQAKVGSVSHSGASSPSLVSPSASTPTPTSNCSISSPSLAAMLRQPASTLPDVGSNENVGSATLPLASLGKNSVTGNSNLTLTLPGGVQIKAEPTDSYSLDSQDTIIMSLPIKREQKEGNKIEYKGPCDGEPSLTNTGIKRQESVNSKGRGMPRSSKAADLETDSSTVKCEH